VRRFVLVAGTSAKFWEVDVAGASLSLRWGALGNDGQTKTKDLGTAAKAEAEQDKLVNKKLAEGYREEGDAPALERPRIAWDAKTRALVHPRRASKIPAPKVDVAKAWTALCAAFDEELDEAVKKGRRKATEEDRALIDEAVAGFASKTPPEKADPVVEGVRAALLDVEGHHSNTPPSLVKVHETLVNFWCARYGVAFAARAMTETFRTVRAYDGTLYVVRRDESFGRFGNINHYRNASDPVDVTPWRVLRAHLAAADDAAYAEARAAADPVHDKGVDVIFRCALAFVFADEEGWARAALEKSSHFIQNDRGSPSIYHCAHALVSCFRDEPTLRKFMAARAFHAEFIYDVLDALGPAAFDLLREHYESGTWRQASAQKQYFAAMTLIESKEVAAWVKRQVHDKVVGPLAEAYFVRCADLR
jgi:predicted DNA-binding WGR domain protein